MTKPKTVPYLRPFTPEEQASSSRRWSGGTAPAYTRTRDLEQSPLSVHQVATALGVHVQTVKRLPASDLPFFRVNSRGDRRYFREDLESYITVRMASKNRGDR